MHRVAPQLLDRIADALRSSGRTRSSADLAREFLGFGVLDESVAETLLKPALAADARFSLTKDGWSACVQSQQTSLKLNACHIALFAPRFAEICASAQYGDGEARYAVCVGGEAEKERFEQRSGSKLDIDVVDLTQTARRLRGYRGRAEPVAIAEHSRLPHVESDTAEGMARLVGTVWETWSSSLREESVESLDDLQRLLTDKLEAADFADKRFAPTDLLDLAAGPGVYRFEDDDQQTLYVGQSAQLGARVCSYFNGPPRDDKDRTIRSNATELVTESVDTAIDALLLEQRWIRRYAPQLNQKLNAVARCETEGAVVVPATAADAKHYVAYVLRGGALASRIALLSGPKRMIRALQTLSEALFSQHDATTSVRDTEAEESGALVDSWRRAHPQALFVEPGLHGGPEQVRSTILSHINER